MPIYTVNLRKALSFIPTILIIISCVVGASIISFLLNNKFKNNVLSTNADPGLVIIIDPGHGGEDPGAIGVNGIYEKDLNLSVALMIGEMLSEKGYTVIYTRTEDKMLYSTEENIKGMRKISDLKNRCAVSNNYENSLTISVHMNTYGSSKYSGLQVYYQDGNNESAKLANFIQGSVKEILQPQNNRMVKNGKNLYLLENCSSNAVLIECGFLSNEEECEKLSEKEYQKQLSFSIVCGIIKYVEQNYEDNN